MTTLDWSAFAAALQVTLRDLRQRTFLIVAWTGGNIYVQFAQSDEALHAEAVGDDAAPPATELGLDAVEAMNRAGWTPPEVQRIGNPNWTRKLAWPATSASYRELADACVIALQLRSVPGPDELEYKAWRDPEPLPEVTRGDEDFDRGDPNLALPSLGLKRAPT